MIKLEEWKIIKDFPNYSVSTLGQIKNNKTNRILKLGSGTGGYLKCNLSKNGKQETRRVHRLVAEAFLPISNINDVVNHKDGDKHNNSVSNLEWTTQSSNIKHSFANNLSDKGEIHYNSKLTQEDVDFIRKNYKPRDKEFSGVALAKRFGVTHQLISAIISNKTWN